jgi:hypothetical protein
MNFAKKTSRTPASMMNDDAVSLMKVGGFVGFPCAETFSKKILSKFTMHEPIFPILWEIIFSQKRHQID